MWLATFITVPWHATSSVSNGEIGENWFMRQILLQGNISNRNIALDLDQVQELHIECESVDFCTQCPLLSCISNHIFNKRINRYRPCKCRSLQWRNNGRDGVSNHQPHDCLLNRLFRRKSKKTSKLRVTGLCVGNSPGTGEFPAQMTSNAENVSIWWHHHVFFIYTFSTWSLA